MLKAAAEVTYAGHEGDGRHATVLHFRVSAFGDVAGELVRQKHLWDDGPQAEETAFELFGAALRDVEERREDSNRFDPALLRRIRRYRRLLMLGVERVSMPDTAAPRQGHIDTTVVSAATALISLTPSPRRVRVAGRVDVMGASERVLKLEIRPGQVVTALWEGTEDIEQLHDLFNQDVVIEGTGVFRPSGSLLRIDADAIALASPADEFFRVIPSASRQRDYQKLARLKPGEPSVYSRLRGSIPPEESDEAFEAALAALR
jgi:hypothetical protein